MHSGLPRSTVYKRTFLPINGERVFLYLPAAEKGPQLRSQSLRPLDAASQYASRPSLPAASLLDFFEQPFNIR